MNLLYYTDLQNIIYVNVHPDSQGDFHFIMKKELILDNIIPGINQEVVRKIYEYSINKGYLSNELFESYK
jgi:hypothetical protein